MKTLLRWYWFLETEVVVAIFLAAGLGLCLLLADSLLLMGAANLCILIGAYMAIAYQKLLHERLGPGQVHAPRRFKSFWRLLVVADMLVALGIVIWSYF